jgi:hypothetical protein
MENGKSAWGICISPIPLYTADMYFRRRSTYSTPLENMYFRRGFMYFTNPSMPDSSIGVRKHSLKFLKKGGKIGEKVYIPVCF